MLTAIIHGFVLAFPLILPLGAQNVFIFNHGAANQKFSRTLPVVITASICDTILISLAVLGISVVVLGSVWIKTLLIGFGVLFLLYMGWLTWRSGPNKLEDQSAPLSIKKQILFTLSVSLLNPHAILDTIGVIGTSSLNYAGVYKFAFAVSTILVSWIWFFSLSLAGRMTGRLDKSGSFVMLLNKISALIMWVAAGYMFITLINK